MNKDDLARLLNGTQKMSDQKEAARALAPVISSGKNRR